MGYSRFPPKGSCGQGFFRSGRPRASLESVLRLCTNSALQESSGTFGSRTPFASRNLLSRRTPDTRTWPADGGMHASRFNLRFGLRALSSVTSRNRAQLRQAHSLDWPSTRVRSHSLRGRSQGGRRLDSAGVSLKEDVYGLLTHLGSSTEDCLDGRPRGAFSILHAEEWLRGIGVPAGYSVPTLVAIITVAWIGISRQVLSTIGAWLYARLSLGADVSLNKARQLARLFQFDLSFRWLPLKRDQAASQDRTKECASGQARSAGTRTKVDVLVIQAMLVGAQ